jgi:probable addiction module antidote protein
MALETTPFDAADFLTSPADVAAYLEEAFASGDPALIAAALGDAARAKGMAKVAADAGLSRESLYRGLSESGNPELATVLKVMKSLGLRLQPVTETSA